MKYPQSKSRTHAVWTAALTMKCQNPADQHTIRQQNIDLRWKIVMELVYNFTKKLVRLVEYKLAQFLEQD